MNENIIILTGGSRGIGHATSKKFGKKGGELSPAQELKLPLNVHGKKIKQIIFK